MVHKKRHLAKAITWRFVSSITTFLIALGVSGSLTLGASIAIVDVLIKIGMYYWHERLWHKSKWGVEL